MNYHKIKINHETPFEMMKDVKSYTDYDYCLVHLCKDNPEYKKYFLDRKNRELILDNSVFELEIPFDKEEFIKGINEINPTYYIVPDFLDDKEATIQSMEDWIKNFAPKITTKSKIIGSIQGRTLKELKDCYVYMSEKKEVEKIAITFNSLAYQEICKDIDLPKAGEDFVPNESNLLRWMEGRQRFISFLVAEGLWNNEKPHHLLGCGYIREFQYPLYHRISIDTLDTSSPTIHGLCNLKYDKKLGNVQKPSMKLCEHLNDRLNSKQRRLILHNIKTFAEIVNKGCD